MSIMHTSKEDQRQRTFHLTLRNYSERLNEEKEKSLRYLNRINQLSEELSRRDFEINRLKWLVEEQQKKLEMYEAIRSQALAKNSLRLIGTKFTESIIELDQVENSESTLVLHPEQDLEIPTNLFGLFEDFFMLKPYQIEHTGNVNYNHSQINYTYKYHNLGVTDEAVRTFLLGNEGECWRLTEYSYEEQNQQKEMFKTINFLFSSHFTGTEDPELSILVKTVNPSYYYFGICLLGKELIALGDKTYKAPVLYGFLSFFPFVNLFKDLTATIYRQLRITADPQKYFKQLTSQLSRLKQLRVATDQCLRFRLANKDFDYMLSKQNVQYLLLHNCRYIYKNYSLQFLIDILMLLLIEIPVMICSTDEGLLGKFVVYFIAVIRPLKYPFPVVINIPSKLSKLLQANYPTFMGTSRVNNLQSTSKNRALFDLDKKIAVSWPIMMDQFIPARECLLTEANKQIRSQNDLGRMRKITNMIINGSKHEGLKLYWLRFSQTLIYQNYLRSTKNTSKLIFQGVN